MYRIEGSKNTVAAQIDADGNVIVGDGNNITVINLKEAAQYKSLEADIAELNTEFEKTRIKAEKYPDDNDFRDELLRIDEKRSRKQQDLATLRQEVLKLAEDFLKIPLNSERLRKAKDHFDKGEYIEARAILDAEKIGKEIDALLEQKGYHTDQLSEINQGLSDKANEFLILARLTAISFDLPDRFKQTVNYYEQSLKAERNVENTFAYALFLQKHNQYHIADSLYEEALKIRRALAEVNPQAYLPDVAMTLINMGIFYLESIQDKEKSLYYCKETMRAAIPFMEYLPAVQNYVKAAFDVVKASDEDPEALFQQVVDEMNIT